MKELIIRTLHSLLGFERYLKVFSVFKIRILRLDGRKSDFLYFSKIVDEHATVLVIGACTGITTVPLAKGHPNRKVLAYEPLPMNFKALNAVIRYHRLSNIATFPVGLGNRAERREILLPVLNGVKKQGIAHIVDPSITEHNDGLSEPVELDLLDNREELKTQRIHAMKLVAENFEYEILEGAKELIATHQPVIYCELWDNEKRQPVLELIRQYGYSVFCRISNELVPYDPAIYAGKSFFFMPAR